MLELVDRAGQILKHALLNLLDRITHRTLSLDLFGSQITIRRFFGSFFMKGQLCQLIICDRAPQI